MIFIYFIGCCSCICIFNLLIAKTEPITTFLLLLQYYTGIDGRGTVDEISAKLREGCPSYFNESDYKYFLAVECLERASMAHNDDERENLARVAFNHLTKVPESVDLRAVCKRFEDLRYPVI